MDEFKQMLSGLPKQLNGNGNDGPLVVIIDELDRCKPTFAIDVIEKIKHLFSVENIAFVLVMNKDQLAESIRCIYGNGIDAHAYLQKFVHLETRIPQIVNEYRASALKRYSIRLRKRHEFNLSSMLDQKTLDYSDLLADHLGLSLRQLEKVYTNLAILFITTDANDNVERRYPPIAAFLAVIKVFNSCVFYDLLSRAISYEKMLEKLKLQDFVSVAATESDIPQGTKKYTKY